MEQPADRCKFADILDLVNQYHQAVHSNSVVLGESRYQIIDHKQSNYYRSYYLIVVFLWNDAIGVNQQH